MTVILIVATNLSLLRLRLTSDQVWAQSFGAADGVASLTTTPKLGAPLPEAPIAGLKQAGASQVVRQLSARISVRGAQGSAIATMYEMPTPSMAIDGRFELREGSWPAKAGECITSSLPGAQELAPGPRPVTITGAYIDLFNPRSKSIVCAPGTWESWQATGEVPIMASVAFFWLASDPATVMQRVHASHPEWYVVVKTSMPSVSATLHTGTAGLPSLVLLFALNAVTSSRMKRWSLRSTSVLAQVGVRGRTLLVAMWLALGLSIIVPVSVGVLGGTLLAGVATPLVRALNSGKMLAPLRLTVEDVLLFVGVCCLGGLVGAALTPSKMRATKPRQIWQPTDHTLQMAAAVLLLVGAAGVLLSRSTVLVAVGAVLIVFSVATFTPVAVKRFARGLANRPVSSRTLAARLFIENGSRLPLLAGGLAAALGLSMSALMLAATAAAGVDARNFPALPPGTASVNWSTDGSIKPISPELMDGFEQSMGKPSHIRIGLGPYIEHSGSVWMLAQPTDARRLVPSLSDDDVAALARGEMLVFRKQDSGTVEILNPPDRVKMDARWVSLPASQRFGAAGLVAGSAAHLTDPSSGMQIYYGLNPNQLSRGSQYVSNHVMDMMGLSVYHPQSAWGIPIWVSLAAVGYCFLVSLTAVLMLRGEMGLLGPTLGGLRAIGLSRSWIRGVAGVMAGMVVGFAGLAALVASTLPLVGLWLALPGAFVWTGVPWWAIAVSIAAVAVAGVIGAIGGAQKATAAGRQLQA